MKLEQLQKKYPEFIYESFAYELKGGELAVSFKFRIPPDIEFTPRLVFKNIDAGKIANVGDAVLADLFFNVGMAEIPSYWKATCSPAIIVKAGYLDKNQVKFWQDLIANGMGQFFYENKLSFIEPKFNVIAKKTKAGQLLTKKLANRYLVPLGGGKDSLVTLELLKKDHQTATLSVNSNKTVGDLLAATGTPNIEVSRLIDPLILKLKDSGYLNGHTPFSSVLSFVSVAAALLFDYKYIAISQERSSNEGNVKYLGKSVNHQYSKSFDFENKFREYIKKNLSDDIVYFSFLRPLYELQIAKIFSSYPKYFPLFLSCNKSFTLAARAAGASGWCLKCPKCLFTFAALYPFIGAQAVEIFGKNLFEQKELLEVMLDLLGQGSCKPFECVGTYAEAQSAFYLSLQKAPDPKPFLLNYFERNLLPKYPKITQESNRILSSWNTQNNLPKFLQKPIKKSLKSSDLDN